MENPGFGRYKFAEELKKGINPKDGKIPEYVIFSLRDAANVPIVYIVGRQTALFNGSQLYSLLGIKGHLLEDPDPEENSGITQVDNHLVPYLKQFFTNLEEKGYKLRSPSDYEDYARVKDLEQDIQISDVPSINLKDEFGLDMSLPNNLEGEGGYLGALGRLGENAIGSPGYGFVRNVAEQGINGLIIYANLVDEMDDLEKAVQDYEENVQEGFYNWTMSIDMENQYPQEDDYYIEPDNKQDQPEFGEEFSGERKFDQERYDEDLRKYDEEMQYLEEDYQPIQIANFFYHKVEEAKVQQSKNNIEMRAKAKDLPAISNLPEIKESTVAKNDNIIKIAAKPVYNADSLAAYIDSLKLFEKEHSDLQKKYQKMIKQLPSSSKVRKDFSLAEVKILYETVGYLWKKITGSELLTDDTVYENPAEFLGNYWLLRNGIFLHGVNHYSIIKKNTNLFTSLLNLNGFTLQEYLSLDPERLLRYIILNGGVRMFVRADKKAFFQISESIYAGWGRDKIKKLPLNPRIVKIIDPKAKYTGWNSGISIKI